MIQDHNEDITVQQSVVEMLTVASEFCLFFDQAESHSAEASLKFFQKIGPLLYLRGCLLPQVEPSDDSFAERFVTEEQWEYIFKSIRDKLKQNDGYFTIAENNEPAMASIAENIADVYQDLKDFVFLFGKNTYTARVIALFQLKSLFANRWGPAVLSALGAIHTIVSSDSEYGRQEDNFLLF